jgi:hypothetical protein
MNNALHELKFPSIDGEFLLKKSCQAYPGCSLILIRDGYNDNSSDQVISFTKM